MKLPAIALLFLLFAIPCLAQNAPPAASTVAPLLSVPAQEGAWVLQVITTGGFTGLGSGNFAVSRD